MYTVILPGHSRGKCCYNGPSAAATPRDSPYSPGGISRAHPNVLDGPEMTPTSSHRGALPAAVAAYFASRGVPAPAGVPIAEWLLVRPAHSNMTM